MGQKLRQGDPWMPGYRYGALLPPLSLNLIVNNVESSVNFYQTVFEAEVHYYDVDFGALRVGAAEVTLHANHTHDNHNWYPQMVEGAARGLGLQIRLLGIDPDETERRAREAGATVIASTADKGHGCANS